MTVTTQQKKQYHLFMQGTTQLITTPSLFGHNSHSFSSSHQFSLQASASKVAPFVAVYLGVHHKDLVTWENQP